MLRLWWPSASKHPFDPVRGERDRNEHRERDSRSNAFDEQRDARRGRRTLSASAAGSRSSATNHTQGTNRATPIAICFIARPSAPPGSRSIRTRGLAPFLRALVAERRAGVQHRSAAAAQAEHAHAVRCHLAMDRRHVNREIENCRGQRPRATRRFAFQALNSRE